MLLRVWHRSASQLSCFLSQGSCCSTLEQTVLDSAWLRLGYHEGSCGRYSFQSCLLLPSLLLWVQTSICAEVGSRLPTALLLVPLALQPTKGFEFLLSDSMIGAASMWLESFTPSQGPHPCNLPFPPESPSQGTCPSLITLSSFLKPDLF